MSKYTICSHFKGDLTSVGLFKTPYLTPSDFLTPTLGTYDLLCSQSFLLIFVGIQALQKKKYPCSINSEPHKMFIFQLYVEKTREGD